jgi:hypothetical protein
MKNSLLIVFCIVANISLLAQEKIYIHKTDNVTLGALVSEIDSAYFSSDGTIAYFRVGSNVAEYLISEIDSISFGENSNTVLVNFSGSSVSVVNPLAFQGVSVTVSEADVIVTSTIPDVEVNYVLSGTTTDGMFKVYSSYKFNLLLNGVNITNANGPAINIQSSKKCSITLEAATENFLTDGSTYASSTEDQKSTLFSEGQLEFYGTGKLTVRGNSKHAICSDDYIDMKSGEIVIPSAKKDGIHVNNYFKMSDGILNITSTGDGIDCELGYVNISGGTVTATSTADDVKGIASATTTTISGGNVTITISGNQSKGLKSSDIMTLSGGTIVVHTSGAAVLEASGSGFDPSYCSGIKCSSIALCGANVTITSIGKGGKGISSDGDIGITSGTVIISTAGAGATYTNASGVIDSYNATCLKANGNINIAGGAVTTSSSGSGGKGISADGTLSVGSESGVPNINVTTTGVKFLVSGSDYCEPKAIKCDGAIAINNGTITISSNDDAIKSNTSVVIATATINITKSVEGVEAPYITVNSGNISIVSSDDSFNATKGNGGEGNDGSCLTFNGGYVVASTTAGDGLDSNGDVVITGGTIIVHGPQSAPEVGLDYNGTCNVSGGLLIISGTNSNMTQAPSSTSTQRSVKVKSSSSIAASTLFHIQDASGNDILTFKPLRSYYSIVFSSSSLTSGSTYQIYTGGTSTGTNTNGLYSGGVYSGGSLRKSFTISSILTNVSF